MIELNFIFSKESEFHRIRNTLNRIDWFEENGYDFKKQLKLPIYDKNASDDEVMRLIDVDWDVSKYLEIKDLILASKSDLDSACSKLDSLFDVRKDSLNVTLSRYGSGGSYWLPTNSIFINVHNIHPVKTVFHELVHLYVQPFIDEFNISHWKKERVVDLILHSDKFSFLNYDNWQGDYQGVIPFVDKEFYSFFENLIAFFRKIS